MGRRTVPIRYVQVFALLTGLLVLVLSVVTNVLSARSRNVEAQDNELGIALRQQTDALTAYFDRAGSIGLVLAGNPAFTDFYRAPGTMMEKVESSGALIHRVQEALSGLEALFPGMIGEACFIDSGGQEIARIVDGVAAAPAQLSAHEDHNAFFAPTLALGPGKVHQARAYQSPDTHDEVISNSTVVEAAGQRGLVHFEIALASFRMPETAAGVTASIIETDTGQTLVDTRTTGIQSADSTTTLLVARPDGTGIVTVGSRRIAFHRIARTVSNANAWTVAVSAPAVTTGWTRGLGVGPLALVAAALLAITTAGIGAWKQLTTARHASLHDALTGLPNRTLLRQRLQSELQGGGRVGLLSVDLEGFTEVNDQLGHPYGDQLLRLVGDRLREGAPTDATVARLGGDDYAVLLLGAGQADATRTAERLLTILHHTFEIDGTGIDLEASIGVACAPDHGDEADVLLRHADTAMHLAQQQHDGAQTYNPAGERHTPNRLALLGDLRRALDADDQITVHYQPKVDLQTGDLAGVEALVRWRHPSLGLVPPDRFISLAETTTLIHALTDRVLGIAVRQAQQWRATGHDIPVAVNLSTRCLHDESLPIRVFDLLDEVGLPSSMIELEVTESMAMRDPERVERVLAALHGGGARLSIDDFGTGYSSMSYLQRLPVDELKIDRSFIQQMDSGDSGTVLVNAAISLGHNLGLTVVAEGIEDAGTAVRLRELGCDIAQGYHFGRPMPPADLMAWVGERTIVDGPIPA
jgi:diguanylate cyclase (GGDEF)-like protein